MKQRSLNTRACAGVAIMAEQELTAFFTAVAERFGSELAELAVEDWLHGLLAMNTLPASAREWRRLSVKASSQLATRVNAEVTRPPYQPTPTSEAVCAAR